MILEGFRFVVKECRMVKDGWSVAIRILPLKYLGQQSVYGSFI